MTMFKMCDAPLDHHSYIRMLESETACMRPRNSSSHAGYRPLLARAFVTPKRPKTKSIHTAARPKWPRTQPRYGAQMFFPRTFSNLINPSFGRRAMPIIGVNLSHRYPIIPLHKFALFGDGWWKCHICELESRNLDIPWRVVKALHCFTTFTHAIWISTGLGLVSVETKPCLLFRAVHYTISITLY